MTCALCSRAYHFACLNPPLTRKPERGYTWACAPCSKQRQDKIEDNLFKGLEAPAASGSGSGCGSSYGSSGRTLRDKGKKKEGLFTLIHLLKLAKPPPSFFNPADPFFFVEYRVAPVTAVVHTGPEASSSLRTVDGWPFRYYGQYTEPASVLGQCHSRFLHCHATPSITLPCYPFWVTRSLNCCFPSRHATRVADPFDSPFLYTAPVS